MYKSIGILGGMGPAATCDLMNKIIQLTSASDDQHHIHIYVDCNTQIPDRTFAILCGGRSPVPEMVKSAVRLQSMGADFIIMPCNTAHYFYNHIIPYVDIPIISMPEETANHMSQKGIKKAALLATDGTVQSKVYENAMHQKGIELIYPSSDSQEKIMSLIYDYIKKGITSPDLLPVTAVLQITAELYQQEADAVILGCTELPIAFELMGIREHTIDPTEILARAAIRYAGAHVTSPSALSAGS